MLWSSSNAAAAKFVKELQVTARALNARLDVHQATNLPELDDALAAIGRSGARSLIVTPSPFAATQRDKLVQFAASTGLPAMYFVDDFADAGGLMSYGPSIVDAYRRAAAYVDKILKGAKPGDLAVEQPTRFELTINLRTARARAEGPAISPASYRPDNRMKGSVLTIRWSVDADIWQNSVRGHIVEIDAQPCAQPDRPARGFYLTSVGTARRLA
jgi:hypothetical protein